MSTPDVPAVPPGMCIFCRKTLDDVTPWCPDNPGQGCTYGLGCERLKPVFVPVLKVRKLDAKLCMKCGLHPKNPAAAISGCDHVYRADFPSPEPLAWHVDEEGKLVGPFAADGTPR